MSSEMCCLASGLCSQTENKKNSDLHGENVFNRVCEQWTRLQQLPVSKALNVSLCSSRHLPRVFGNIMACPRSILHNPPNETLNTSKTLGIRIIVPSMSLGTSACLMWILLMPDVLGRNDSRLLRYSCTPSMTTASMAGSQWKYRKKSRNSSVPYNLSSWRRPPPVMTSISLSCYSPL